MGKIYNEYFYLTKPKHPQAPKPLKPNAGEVPSAYGVLAIASRCGQNPTALLAPTAKLALRATCAIELMRHIYKHCYRNSLFLSIILIY